MGKGKNIIIIILVLCVLGLGSFVVYDKLLTKEETTKQTTGETNKVESLEIDSEEVLTLLNQVSDINKISSSDYFGYLYKQKNISSEELGEYALASAVYKAYSGCGENCTEEEMEFDQKKVTIKEEFVKETFQKIFGNIEYKAQDLKELYYTGLGFGNFKYVKEKAIYEESTEAWDCSCCCPTSIETNIIKAEKDTNSLDIYTKVMFIDPKYSCIDGQPTTYTLYSDYERKNQIDVITSEEQKTAEWFVTYKEKLQTYIYHYEKENGNYVFKNIKQQ